MSRPERSSLVCGLLGCVFAASTLLWLKLDRAPPNWDDAWYLTNSLTVYDALTQGGVVGYLTKLNSVFGFKAPLIAALPAGFYLLLGRHWHAAYLVNIVAMWALFAALYRIAKRWWSARAAIFAIAIAGTMPLLYGLARWYMVEYVLTALLAVAACVIESDGLKRDRPRRALWCDLRIRPAAEDQLPAVHPSAVRLHVADVWPPRTAIAAGRSALPASRAALVCRAFQGYGCDALDAAFGAPAAIQGTGPVFSISTITTYFSHVAENGISWYFCFLGVVLSLCAVVRRQDTKKSAGTAAVRLAARSQFSSSAAIRMYAISRPCCPPRRWCWRGCSIPICLAIAKGWRPRPSFLRFRCCKCSPYRSA